MNAIICKSDDGPAVERLRSALETLGMHKQDEYVEHASPSSHGWTKVERHTGVGKSVTIESHNGIVEVIGAPGAVLSVLAHFNKERQ